MIDKYKRAYTEILEIIKYFPNEEYSKIPSQKIDYYKENMDKNYNFQINPNIDLEKQNISKETNAILVALFRDYFADERQKQVLDNLLNQNQQKLEKEKLKNYNPKELFKHSIIQKTDSSEIQKNKNETGLVEYKESFFIKFINWVMNIFKR